MRRRVSSRAKGRNRELTLYLSRSLIWDTSGRDLVRNQVNTCFWVRARTEWTELLCGRHGRMPGAVLPRRGTPCRPFVAVPSVAIPA